MSSPATTFTRFAWAFAAYLLAVILWGAWVRISGSGAGCGDHWPLCNGVLVPNTEGADGAKTLVEYAHRVTSAVTGPLAILLVVWSWRKFANAPRVRTAAIGVAAFVVLEGAVGAGLVLKELVKSDASVARAVVIAIHLVNTLALMASISVCAYWSGPSPARERLDGATRRGLAACLLGVVVVSAAGAVTALGDTVFPVAPYAESSGFFAHLRSDLEPGAHFLVRLRLWHPIMALVVAVFLLVVLGRIRQHEDTVAARFAGAATAFLWGQLALGIASVVLRAPGWLQLAHLLFAQFLWCSLCLTLASSVSSQLPADE